MKRSWMFAIARPLSLLAVAFALGCEDGGGDDGGSSGDIGPNNDPNVVVALGDSITSGIDLPAADTYPAQLATLTGRAVVNSGNPGEKSSGGRDRVGSVLARHHPGYLLILYGANDLIFDRSKTETVDNIRAIIQTAKANQTVPIVATLTPTFPYHDFIAGEIPVLNDMIKEMARGEGVSVADLYGPLNDPSLFQSDGLHPTAAGNAKIASVFAGKL